VPEQSQQLDFEVILGNTPLQHIGHIRGILNTIEIVMTPNGELYPILYDRVPASE
jgi:hypothetical protein